MFLSENDLILFSGDSITDGNRVKKMDCNHIMGHGYTLFLPSLLLKMRPVCRDLPIKAIREPQWKICLQSGRRM